MQAHFDRMIQAVQRFAADRGEQLRPVQAIGFASPEHQRVTSELGQGSTFYFTIAGETGENGHEGTTLQTD
jgi:hypothetical protein